MSRIVALCGPSGAGKTAVLLELTSIDPEIRVVGRITTRAIHGGDTDRAEYETVSRSVFLSEIAEGQLADFTEHHGVLYGVRRSAIATAIDDRAPTVLVSGTASAIRLKQAYPADLVLAYIYPGDVEELRTRGLDESSPVNRELLRRLSDRGPRASDDVDDFGHWLHVRMTRNLSRAALLLAEMDRGLDVTVIANRRDEIGSALVELQTVLSGSADRPYSNAHLPKKRVGASALFINDKRQVLIVKPSYRRGWLTPGGTVDEDETPRNGCTREVREELGRSFAISQLLCVEYRSAHGAKVENLQFVFWGGELDDEAIASIQLPNGELTEFKFCDEPDLDTYLNSALAHRVRTALAAQERGHPVYLEDQVEVS